MHETLFFVGISALSAIVLILTIITGVCAMKYDIQVLKKNKDWYWKVVSCNGKTVCVSETYENKGNAIRSAKKFHLFLKFSSLSIQPTK